MNLAERARAAWRRLQWRELRACLGPCPYCGPTLLLRLDRDETGVRCIRCGASAVHLSAGWALAPWIRHLPAWHAYELSSRGPLVDALRRRCRHLTLSEFFEDVAPGTLRAGVRCEDVQRLSFPDACFDLVTHTEVFEHVPDDAAGWRELWRVLRPGGVMLFTVPICDAAQTVERAVLRDGGIEHLLPPAWHSDRLRGTGRVLCFRDYGRDIVERVAAAGFTDVALSIPDPRVPWKAGRRVVTARKSA